MMVSDAEVVGMRQTKTRFLLEDLMHMMVPSVNLWWTRPEPLFEDPRVTQAKLLGPKQYQSKCF